MYLETAWYSDDNGDVHLFHKCCPSNISVAVIKDPDKMPTVGERVDFAHHVKLHCITAEMYEGKSCAHLVTSHLHSSEEREMNACTISTRMTFSINTV